MTAPGVVRDCPHTRVQHQHGTRAAYVRDKCRCWPCCLAASNANATKDWSSGGYMPSIGLTRRLRAMAVAGWSCTEIIAEAGMHRRDHRVYRIRAGEYPNVLTDTHRTLVAACDRLWRRTPPNAALAARTRAAAERAGWVPMLAWDDDSIDDPAAEPQGVPTGGFVKATVDEVAVAAALSGRRLRLNYVELDEAIRQATARGWSAAKVAAVLGTTPRTVQRRRAA